MKKNIYIKLNHFTVHQKLTQHCKSTILQFLKVFLKTNFARSKGGGLLES